MNDETEYTNLDLINDIKYPDRYFRITLHGYGGESVYSRIPEKAYNYWIAKEGEEYFDDDLTGYMADPDGFAEERNLPADGDFMKSDPNEEYRDSWYEMAGEIEHAYGVEFNNAFITIEEIESDDYNAPIKDEIIASTDLDAFVQAAGVEVENNEFDLDKYALEDDDGNSHNYIFYGMSAEKGTFFDGILHLKGEKFEERKLKIFTCNYPNGDQIVHSVEYADKGEIDNQGGDTNGKGYYAAIWDY